MVLGSTQPVTEMCNRGILWRSKGGRCVGLSFISPSCADFLQVWELQPPVALRTLTGIVATLYLSLGADNATLWDSNHREGKTVSQHRASFRHTAPEHLI